MNENNLARIEENKVFIKPDGVSMFGDSVHYWVNFFGLTDWQVLIIDSDDTDTDNPIATINTNTHGRCATITIYTQWNTDAYNLENVEFELNKSAFHEVCHLLLADIRDLAHAREFNPDHYYKAEEIVVRKMENSFYREMKKKYFVKKYCINIKNRLL